MSDTLLRDSQSRATNLPVDLTSFVGRRTELSKINELMRSARLVTLVGPGGVGKTRLAVRATSGLSSSAPDGVWFVDLSGLRDSSLLVDMIANAVRVVSEPGTSRLRSLVDYLQAGRSLLLLDNCEHQLDECAQIAGALLQACPGLRILATSREPLALAGEATLVVPPMPAPEPGTALESLIQFESVTLFAGRASEFYPDLLGDERTLGTIGEICFRLDGLPLAIELAAVRLRVLSPDQLLERLRDPYRLLTGGSRNGPERQRTLRASIEWSYDLCTPAERTVWARLSVFAGGCELDAAEGICSGGDVEPEQLLDVLQSLVEKSILVRDERSGTAWFRMLETIREFGAECLEASGEAAQVLRRHRDWYQGLLERAEADWISPRQRLWLARMYGEIGNLRAALSYSLDAGCNVDPAGADRSALSLLVPAWRICWYVLGRAEELRTWLDRALAVAPANDALRGRGHLIRAFLPAIQRRPELGEVDLAVGRRLVEATGDRAGCALAEVVEGIAAHSGGDFAAAVSHFERALGEPLDLGWHLFLLAELAASAVSAGEGERAASAQAQAIELSQAHGELFERTFLHYVVGVSAWSGGDLERAEALMRACLRIKRDLDDPVGDALAVQMLGCIAGSNADPERAAYLLAASPRLWRRAGTLAMNFPSYKTIVLASEQEARLALGETAYERVAARSAAAELDDVIAFALGDPAPSRTAAGGRPDDALTPREEEVARLVAAGWTNKQIAEKLFIAVRTAEGHVERIRSKLGLPSRTQVAAWVHRNLRDEQAGD